MPAYYKVLFRGSDNLMERYIIIQGENLRFDPGPAALGISSNQSGD